MSREAQYKTPCAIHGSGDKLKNAGNTKWVGVNAPKGRKERNHGGCPVCKKLAMQAQAKNPA